MTPKAHIELFHLLFMEQLSQKLDKRLYALKGGCNLRFFLKSIRYSEDIDIDLHTIAPHTLEKTVNKILTSQPFTRLLKTHQINIANYSTPKQTTTTQRWKVQLAIPHQSLPINTKIEFSRRDQGSDALTEIISRELISIYQLRPIFLTHYPAATALQQKVNALIFRTETQARDIFDIHHLLQTNQILINPSFTLSERQTAIRHARQIDFAAFKSQVISYLEPDHQNQYDDATIWSNMLETVCAYLEDDSA